MSDRHNQRTQDLLRRTRWRDAALSVFVLALGLALTLADRPGLPDGTLITMLGAALSLLMAGWTYSLLRARTQALRTTDTIAHSLRQSQRRLALIVEASGAGILEWERDTDALSVSPGLASMLGVAGAHVPSTLAEAFERVHPDDRGLMRRALDAHIQGGPPIDLTLRVRGAGVSPRWFRIVGQAMRDAQGRATLVAGSLTDVHDQREAQEHLSRQAADLSEANEVLEAQALELTRRTAELEAARAEAEAANRSKSAFLAHMSHEIRTPMTAILGFADLLAEDARLDAALAPFAERASSISRNAQHLLGLLNDILDLSKIEAGKLTLERIACCPLTLLDEVAALLDGRASSKRLALIVEPVFPLPRSVLSDPFRVRQILTNLVSNAIKFTDAGSVTLRVCLERGACDVVRFEVADTGIGMTQDEQAALYAPFHQRDASTARRFGGTGLGLTISRQLAHALGGTLSARSTLGEGSCFTLQIPAGPIDEPDLITQRPARTAHIAHAPGDAAPRRLSARVLLAEDGPDNQRLIRTLLERAGASVRVVGDGVGAVDEALAASDAGQPFDIILMDMQMPTMNGDEATRQLRARGYRAPIVALTAAAMNGDRQRCLDAGCDDYATKPIDRAALLRTCAQWSGARGARSAA